ncbi:MAG: metallophosphoesterase [bacterium]
MSKRLNLLAVALMSLAMLMSWSVLAQAAEPSLGDCPLRFAVIGDRTGTAIEGKYERALASIERLKPEFSITVGDMIEGYTSDTTEMARQWREYHDIMKALSAPVHFTPGNHDITRPEMLGAYERETGRPYHSFDARGVHFIVLDTSRYMSVSALPEEEMAWLAADLEAAKGARYIMVFYHVPLWRQGVAAGKADPLHKLLVKYGVDAVFTGHDHMYYSARYDGIAYTGVGASGGASEPGLTGLEHHFVWVTVSEEGLSIAPLRVDAVLPWDEVTVAEIELANEMRAKAISLTRISVGSALRVPATPVTLTLRNLGGLPLKAPLVWDIPEGWAVVPAAGSAAPGAATDTVELAAGESRALQFAVSSDTRIYPAPGVSIRYPVAPGKSFDLKATIPVARTAYANKAAQPPEIDGEVTEPAWRDPVTDFFAPDGSAQTAEPAEFYFAWDRDNLYIAAVCMESRVDSIVASATARDGSVYAEDCAGYFFQPVTEDGPLYQIYFSALGTVFDQKMLVEHGVTTSYDADWNGAYEVKTSRGPDRWTMEAKIPLIQFGPEAKAGDRWNMNFRRKQPRLATAADWQVPVGYDPAIYGILELR